MQVRCPSCGRRFALTGTVADEAGDPVSAYPDAGQMVSGVEDEELPVPGQEMPPPVTDDDKEAGTDLPSAGGEEQDRIRRRAVRLSRALISKMIQGQKERLIRARREENILLEFGEEIVTVWETYLTKMGHQDDLVNSSFRDTLNEILADGKKLF